jgi:hypothetical protein
VNPPHKDNAAQILPPDDDSVTGSRIAAMLDRWETEDVSDEPEWDLTDIEPVMFRTSEHASQDSGEHS